LIRQARLEAGLSQEQVAERTNLPVDRLKEYESSEIPVPFPELEAIAHVLNRSVKDFQDRHGPVGAWAFQQTAMQGFAQMPSDLQSFVSQPANWPYLEVARRLSEMSAEKLRLVAEGLLEITL
jgi:transcriptional regulator with XRE-family HTH domain